jgi:hypothetical protein
MPQTCEGEMIFSVCVGISLACVLTAFVLVSIDAASQKEIEKNR